MSTCVLNDAALVCTMLLTLYKQLQCMHTMCISLHSYITHISAAHSCHCYIIPVLLCALSIVDPCRTYNSYISIVLCCKQDVTAAFYKYLAVILGERTEAAEDAMFTRKVREKRLEVAREEEAMLARRRQAVRFCYYNCLYLT
jgi:hypothetical protein